MGKGAFHLGLGYELITFKPLKIEVLILQMNVVIGTLFSGSACSVYGDSFASIRTIPLIFVSLESCGSEFFKKYIHHHALNSGSLRKKWLKFIYFLKNDSKMEVFRFMGTASRNLVRFI